MTAYLTLQPIGVVRSAFKTTHEIPLQGGRATLEIHRDFADGLDGLENSSHLLVMGYLHLADRGVLKARPAKVDPGAPARGVFATRSPVRPNPISLTVVPLLSKEGLQLAVDNLDLVDGTPLVDLKAYAPGWDSVFCARHEHRASPAALDDLRLAACLERDLRNFMGPAAQDPAGRWGLAATFVGARALGVDPREPSMSVQVNRLDATTEALMALTGAAFFNGRLAVAPDERALRVRFRREACFVELVAARDEPPCEVEGWAHAFTSTMTGAATPTFAGALRGALGRAGRAKCQYGKGI
jgi:tRNA (adenine37-N6)-methyltransferase